MNDKYLLHDRLLEILDDILDKRSHGIVAGDPDKTDAIKLLDECIKAIETSDSRRLLLDYEIENDQNHYDVEGVCSDLIADEDKLEKLLENQQIIKTPVVRNGKQSTLGYQPEVWKKWE